MVTATPDQYAAEMLAIAHILDREGAFYGPAAQRHGNATAAALRESAVTPPDCEEAFRYRLCLLLDWHPRRNKRDLDAAVARANTYTAALNKGHE